ncbi:DUF58 domain-containing protein [Leucobacter sp. W1153]|uniref:DUF58 domain-containing protein n=1 Tax=Leucobacter sp. W1153 TaxID=3439064 RepID=UPI003F319C66
MRDIRVRPLGLFALVILVMGVLAGASFGWIEAWFVALAAAALLLTAWPFLLGSRDYRASIRLSRQSVVAGGEVHAEIEVENSATRPQLPALIELPVGEALREILVPMLGGQQSATMSAVVPAMRRGVVRVGPLTVARRDPLGMLGREVTWPDSHLVHVHPVTAPLPPGTAGLVRDLEGAPSRRLTDADLSFHAVREYAPGDALRNVHWKSTAKTGTLMVRQFEESQTARVAVLFDARRDEYASDDEFELGVSLAASLSVQAVREGRERFIASTWAPGRVRPSVDGVEEVPSRDVVQLLDAWAELRPATEHAARIESLTRGLAESRRQLSIVYVVTGSIPGLDRLRRAAAAFTPDVRVVAARCEWLADPALQHIDPFTVCTVGALGDLPRLMLRGSR